MKQNHDEVLLNIQCKDLQGPARCLHHPPSPQAMQATRDATPALAAHVVLCRPFLRPMGYPTRPERSTTTCCVAKRLEGNRSKRAKSNDLRTVHSDQGSTTRHSPLRWNAQRN